MRQSRAIFSRWDMRFLPMVMAHVSELITSPGANLSERCAGGSQSPWLRH
jgi:hypothetical protein